MPKCTTTVAHRTSQGNHECSLILKREACCGNRGSSALSRVGYLLDLRKVFVKTGVVDP